MGRLTALKIAKLRKPGLYADGENLWHIADVRAAAKNVRLRLQTGHHNPRCLDRIPGVSLYG